MTKSAKRFVEVVLNKKRHTAFKAVCRFLFYESPRILLINNALRKSANHTAH